MSNNNNVTTGRLLKNDQKEFVIRELELRDLFDLFSVHKTILENLKEDQKCFIHHKSISQLRKMIENPNQLMLGTFVDDRMIGYSSANFIHQGNINEVLPDFNMPWEADKIVVLEQASVNPEYRGNNLASVMNACRQKIAQQRYGKKYAVTMVDIHNYFSYRNGFRNGMNITQATIDPDDGGQIVYLTKEFGKEQKIDSKAPTQEINYDKMTLEAVAPLINSGYVANGFNDEKRSVIFSKQANKNNLTLGVEALCQKSFLSL